MFVYTGQAAAAGRHLWPSPPSGLLWLQIVPTGSQGLGLWMSEMVSGGGWEVEGGSSWMDRLLPFCSLAQHKFTAYAIVFISFFLPFRLFFLWPCRFVSSVAAWLTDVHQLQFGPHPCTAPGPTVLQENLAVTAP